MQLIFQNYRTVEPIGTKESPSPNSSVNKQKHGTQNDKMASSVVEYNLFIPSEIMKLQG